MGANSTCRNDTIPGLLRPCSLMTPRAALNLPPPLQHALPRHIPCWWDEFQSASSEGSRLRSTYSDSRQSLALLHPQALFTALLMDPLAVKARALLPRCSSDCGCTTRLAHECRQPMFQFRVSVRTFWDLCQQQAAVISAEDRPGLVATDSSLKTLCQS